MELYTLKINVTNQRLSFGENKPEIFSGDQSIDFVEFTFEDAMWNFPDIWAIFSRQKGTSYQVALEDNKVMIPAEVMQKRGYVYIGLMATDGENVQTSNVLQYSIGQGSTNVDAITPSASIYEQFLADLDAYQTAVADLDDIESRITTAEGNVSMIEQAVTDLNEQLGDIYVDISTINGQITTIQNNIGTAQGDIVSIQNGINTLNGQVAGLDTAVGTLSNRVTALQSSVTSLEGRLTTAGNTLTDFEGRLTTAGTTLTNLEGSISDAENDIQTVQGDIETIQSDIEDIQTAIEQNNVVTDVTAEGISLVDNHIADLSFMCVTDTASGDVASFPDGSGVAMKKAEVSLEPIQDLSHGDPSPTNICPIDGYEDVGLYSDSKYGGLVEWNQLSDFVADSRTFAGLNFTSHEDGTVTVFAGTPSGTFYTNSPTTYNNVNGHVFFIGGCPSGGSATTYYAREGYTAGSYIIDIGNGNIVKKTDDRALYQIFVTSGATIPTITYKPQLIDLTRLFGATKADEIYAMERAQAGAGVAYFKSLFPNEYYEYNAGEVMTVGQVNGDETVEAHTTLPETIYGGTVDVVSGRLVVDRGYVDLGTLTWSTPTASGRMSASAGAMPITSSTDLYNVISDTYATITARSWYNATATGISICGAGYGVNGNIGISDPNLVGKTSAEAKSYVTGIHAVYPLETPQTYQLTPQQIQTLVGANNVWSEDGTIEVEYIANLKDYIDKKINA